MSYAGWEMRNTDVVHCTCKTSPSGMTEKTFATLTVLHGAKVIITHGGGLH